ncbi:unnamed protein product [Aphanomyces euteiches]|uniref:Tryptophan synthase beta chain-like PALP domain-containing protein n=1 Tax=Aphanomyces euteiches TaxID=100861 RepID=A0A6G0X4R6_9STRA|nr:hypothetical protein Ae201684_008502 [Aphanomyces euteiches]KAH9143634.1 hypothetical protein AeRB84_012427 [Aphanomyces euteiches]
MPGHKKFLETVPYTAPAWTSQLASPPSERVVLGNFPTPIFPFRPPGLPHDVQMYIKRDDYSGLEMSGNKARKLEFLLAEALKEGADCVVTCGGVQSNHCRATAVAARMLGLDSYLLLRTNDADVNDDPGLVGNLLVDRLVGANLIVVPRREYAKRGGGDYFIAKTCERLRAQGRKPYAIPVGGSNGLGTWGYIESIEEIESQIEALDMTVTDIAFACGSGGSAAGIAVGAYLYAKYNEESALQFTREGLPPVHAYIVCDSPKYFFDHIDKVILPGMGIAGENPPFIAKDCLQITNSQGLGYAKSTQEELEYISKVARETGVLLDPVYSGKALFGLIKELQTTPEKFAGKHILFVHTGGMFGLYDKVAELQPGVLASRDISLFQLED